ncbi:MAG TPA: glycoside hydrolase family 2 protein [Terriglobales bacterium]|nr:glycoside hydrolase family 2 protein [Terriglobales bacterium]
MILGLPLGSPRAALKRLELPACLLIFMICVCTFGIAAVQSRTIHEGWRFRALSEEVQPAFREWRAASVPGVVQTDLLENKLIPDPFYQTNEYQLQWIGLTDWEYQTEFTVDQTTLGREHVELVFDGLDTFAEVWLNGHNILNSENMFRTWRVECKKDLQAGANTLRIVFRSPVMKLLPKLEKLPYHLLSVNTAQTGAERGIPTDPFTRKAPYHYGWDWGPRFVTLGIWRPVHLESWDGLRISDVYIRQDRIRTEEAQIRAQVEVESSVPQVAKVTVEYGAPGVSTDTASVSTKLNAGTNVVDVPIRIASPKLWYPAGYGNQDRYKFSVVVRGSKEQDRREVLSGLRSVELRRQKDQWGKSFEFVVNGIPVFAKGANVIPFDSFLPRVTPERYRKILLDARAAHMNMIREWGGGAYENDVLYELCDELGILVWQDFMFGGALVPGDAEFQENVRQEAIDNIKRLRNHPSVVLWCGNNETETGWKNWGDRMYFKNSVPPEERERIWQDYVVLFRDILKSAVREYAPDLPYWPSSPGSNFEPNPDGQSNGDVHYWSVWHALNPIEDYTKQLPRFMSEYGFQSFPEMATIRTFAQPDEFAINSRTMQGHQKNTGGNERILAYMLREYREPKDFPSFVYMSQVLQAEAIKTAAEHLRRLRPRNMGSLYWQLNDCWPVASWSSIDYTGRWKALHYYAVRFYDDQIVSPFRHDGKIEIFVINDKLQPLKGTVRQRLMAFDGKLLSESVHPVDALAQSSTVIGTVEEKTLLGNADPRQVFAVYDLVRDGKAISRNVVLFGVTRDLQLPHANVEAKLSQVDGKPVLSLSAPVFAKAVGFTFGDLMVQASDNYFDLLPGETRTVTLETTASIDALQKALTVNNVTDASAPAVTARTAQ